MANKLLTMLFCALLFGCGPSVSDLNVQATWGKNLSELGITPIYPPAEDLQVGDIELYVQNPCDTGVVSNQPQAIKLGSIPMADVQAALESYYHGRQNLPSTSKSPETKPALAKGAAVPAPAKAEITTTGSATVSLTPSGQTAGGATQTATASSSSPAVQPQPSADAQHPIFPGKSTHPITRLRLAAFPDFSFSDFTSGGIGTVIPAHAVTVSAGADKQKSKLGMVSVSQVEEQMLPGTQMFHLVRNYLRGPHGSDVVNQQAISWWKNFLEDNMVSMSGCTRYSSKDAYIVVMGHLYYARTFNYQFSQSEAVAANLRVALAAAAAAAKASQTASSTATASTNSAQVAADAAASALKDIGSSSSPGVAASLEIGSQGGLTLKQSYDRPMAFGVNLPMFWSDKCALAMVNHENAC